jgi:copper homeostasis protein (lipoprotein)
MISTEQQRTVLKRMIFCAGMAFLFLACLAVGYRPESSVQGTSPGKAGSVKVAPSAGAGPLPADEGPIRPPATVDSAGLKLPATLKGTLPCADCEGIRYHLDLWLDGVFHLRQTYLGKSRFVDDRGRWDTDPSRTVISLHGSRERLRQFEVKGPHTIRLLDQQGRPIESSLPYELTGDGTLTPTDVSLELQGMFRYMADAARFEDCLSGRSYPVAMKGDYIQLERAYLKAAKPESGAPLMASFEGDITGRPAMEGNALTQTVVVRRFIGVWPDQSCEHR